jgi:hypothetical protein
MKKLEFMKNDDIFITEKQVSAFEKKLKIKIPKSYRDLLLKFNGFIISPNIFLCKPELGYNLENQKDKICKVYLEEFFSLNELKNNFDSEIIPKDLLPIGMCIGGRDKILIGLYGEKINKIYFWDYHNKENLNEYYQSYSNIYYLCESLDDLFNIKSLKSQNLEISKINEPINITEKKVSKLEKKLKIQIPKLFRDLLLQYNGFGIVPNSFVCSLENGYNLENSNDKIYQVSLEYFHSVKDIELDFNSDSVPKDLLTISRCNGGGDRILIGLFGEKEGKIYYWDHENQEELDEDFQSYANIYYLCESIEELMNIKNLRSYDEEVEHYFKEREEQENKETLSMRLKRIAK